MINAICLPVVLEKRISTNQTGIASSGKKRGVTRQLNINLSQWHKIKSIGGRVYH